MRDDFAPKVKLTLAHRVSNRCSNPSCRRPTSGPGIDPTKHLNIGVAAHITAAASRGPRYDPALSPKERKHPNNGIWLCQFCGKLVDNDEVRYTENVLRQWKASAEAKAAVSIEKPSTLEVGNLIVHSWFVDVINPLLRRLEREQELLQQKKWTWEAPPGHLKYLRPIKDYVISFADTLDQFLGYYPAIKENVDSHDQGRLDLFVACKNLQHLIEKEEPLWKIYLQAKTDDSMTRQGEALNKVFNIDSEREHLEGITQCIVNQSGEMPIHFVYYAVWNKYRDDLLTLLKIPSINLQNQLVEHTGENLLKTTQRLIELLKDTRSQLSLEHREPINA